MSLMNILGLMLGMLTSIPIGLVGIWITNFIQNSILSILALGIYFMAVITIIMWGFGKVI